MRSSTISRWRFYALTLITIVALMPLTANIFTSKTSEFQSKMTDAVAKTATVVNTTRREKKISRKQTQMVVDVVYEFSVDYRNVNFGSVEVDAREWDARRDKKWIKIYYKMSDPTVNGPVQQWEDGATERPLSLLLSVAFCLAAAPALFLNWIVSLLFGWIKVPFDPYRAKVQP
jgi:hypothetical protein